MEIKDSDTILGCWFVGTAGCDWLLVMWVTDGEIRGEGRVRIHVDEKTFDSKDEKSWVVVKVTKDTPEARLEHVELGDKLTFDFKRSVLEPVAEKLGNSVDDVIRFFGGTGEEFTGWLLAQHFTTVRPESFESSAVKGGE